jgi:hypothetical protein
MDGWNVAGSRASSGVGPPDTDFEAAEPAVGAGLRLEAAREVVDVLVIDSAERPAPD